MLTLDGSVRSTWGRAGSGSSSCRDIALQVAEVEVMAVVEHPPARGASHDRGVGQPHPQQRAVARPQIFQAQHAGSVGQTQDGN
jgi:hypothetical protein